MFQFIVFSNHAQYFFIYLIPTLKVLSLYVSLEIWFWFSFVDCRCLSVGLSVCQFTVTIWNCYGCDILSLAHTCLLHHIDILTIKRGLAKVRVSDWVHKQISLKVEMGSDTNLTCMQKNNNMCFLFCYNGKFAMTIVNININRHVTLRYVTAATIVLFDYRIKWLLLKLFVTLKFLCLSNWVQRSPHHFPILPPHSTTTEHLSSLSKLNNERKSSVFHAQR